MNSLGRIRTLKRVARAVVTNQVARWAPGLYFQLTGDTGRGLEHESVHQVADYFRNCFAEYFSVLGLSGGEATAFLARKRILEYGPGDVPAIAVLMVAHGAEMVFCADRFPLVKLSPKNVQVLLNLMDRLDGRARERAASCFRVAGRPESGLAGKRIHYIIDPAGVSGLHKGVDLVVSRAVLEHVNDLSVTVADMFNALRPGGDVVHLVDLKSHGLHEANPLDFLTWAPRLWSLMYSHKGVPNRWRVNSYREALAKYNFEALRLDPVAFASQADVEWVRPRLAAPFRDLSDTDLSWLEFWIVGRKSEAQ